VWFDAEYSSIDLEEASLLQVAALITDSSLRRILPREQDVRLIVRPPEGAGFSPWVKANLGDLVSACRTEQAVDVADADDRLAAYVDAVVGARAAKEENRPLLAGNSIHFDWWLIRRFLPRFLGRLNYRHLDVSAFKVEWRRIHPKDSFNKDDPNMIKMYFPDAFLPDSGVHDAYYDAQASIAELEFYRRYLFLP
jgi:oligoribonuclease (3'-5' exoribonuclease)